MANAAQELATLRKRRNTLKAAAAEKRARLKAAEQSQLRALNARILRAHSRVRSQARRDDTRRKILAGAWVLHEAGRSQAAAAKLRRDLDGFLERDRDRALFELEPRAGAG